METPCGEHYGKHEGECQFCPLDKDECQFWIMKQEEKWEYQQDAIKEMEFNHRKRRRNKKINDDFPELEVTE